MVGDLVVKVCVKSRLVSCDPTGDTCDGCGEVVYLSAYLWKFYCGIGDTPEFTIMDDATRYVCGSCAETISEELAINMEPPA